jgi:hypothetical protein
MVEPESVVLAKIGSAEVLLEVADLGGVSEVSLRDVLSTEAVWSTLEEITQAIQTVWQKVKPSEAEIEFGLGCAVKSGVLHSFVVGASGNANFKVKMKWQPRADPTSD